MLASWDDMHVANLNPDGSKLNYYPMKNFEPFVIIRASGDMERLHEIIDHESCMISQLDTSELSTWDSYLFIMECNHEYAHMELNGIG